MQSEHIIGDVKVCFCVGHQLICDYAYHPLTEYHTFCTTTVPFGLAALKILEAPAITCTRKPSHAKSVLPSAISAHVATQVIDQVSWISCLPVTAALQHSSLTLACLAL
jgi:hypothetical protein